MYLGHNLRVLIAHLHTARICNMIVFDDFADLEVWNNLSVVD